MAEKPTFGDDFYKWVSNDSEKISLNFTKANYAQRIQNYFSLYFDFQFRKLKKINDELSELSLTYNTLEQQLSEYPDGDNKIELEKWVKRSEASSNIIYRLVELRNDFNEIQTKLSETKILWSKKNFNEEGLFHISYEILLESFMKLGSEYSTKLNQTYGVTVSFSTDTSDSNASISPDTHYEEGGMLSTVVQTAYSAGYVSGPWAIVIVAIIVAYEFWKMEEERKEFEKQVKKQQKKYAEAIKLLGSKIPSPEQRFNIYDDILNEIWNRDDIREAKSNFNNLLSNLDKLWLSLFKAVTSQKFISDSYLTVSKVQEVKERYLNDNVVKRIFDQISSFDLLQLLRENWNSLLNQRSILASYNTKSINAIKDIESYYDDLYTSYLFLKDLQSKSSSIPFIEMIPKQITFIKNELGRLKENNDFLPYLDVTVNEVESFYKKKEKNLIDEINIIDRELEYSCFKSLKKLPLDKQINFVNQDRLNWINNENGNGFGLTLSLNDLSYRSRFGNRYDNLNDNVMNSPFDGGYSIDNRRASADIKKNIDNIKDRTEFLEGDFQDLERTMKRWISSNRNSLSNININSNTLNDEVSTNSFEFETIHRENLEPLMDSMDDILDNIQTSSSLSQRLRNSGIESGNLSLLPGHMANPNNSILNSYGYTQRHYPNNQNQSDLEFEFLKKKKDNYQNIVQNRVRENHSNNRLDPIIGNQEGWIDYLQRSKAYWRIADVLSNINTNESNWDFFKLNDVRNFYLNKSEELMYSAIGAVEQSKISEYNFISEESSEYVREQLQEELNDYFDGSLPTPPEGLENYACNIFVANALLEVYGVPDLYNSRRPDGNINLANVLIGEVNDSEKWTSLGVATSQSDIDNAAYYASIGFPVLAVKAVPGGTGHVSLVSPGYPNFKSGLWARRANPSDELYDSQIPYSIYKNLRLPGMINYSIDKPRNSGFNISFSFVFSNPEGVIFYIRKP
ncbi:hypothetical protein [Salegentibacter mishustinae]|uniref:hypothetical protein n=1 Tax=Salegentibacter mishustinae TaxID=270918 RepID=UPI00249063CA|nr:hypothetical protein [Salegentibacter mishustinae]